MKAIFFEEHGGPEKLKFAELEDPKPASGEALIRVKAVALNHLDIWVREGWKGLSLKMPHISGSDIAGEIISVNSSGSTWNPGTKVIVNPGINLNEDEWTRKGEDSLSPGYRIIGEQTRGGMAEFVSVPIANVFKMPEEMKFSEAAAPILVGTTAWRMLLKRGCLRAGESVLVVGAGGGLNSLVIQLAKRVGATVIALTKGKRKIQKAALLGADEVLDYEQHPNWSVEILKITKGRGVDVVVDNVGAATFPHSIRAVSRGGRILTVGNTSGYQISFDNRLFFTKQVSLIGSTMGSRQDFIDAMQFIWNNEIKIPIDCVEPLKNGISMLEHLQSGSQFGKVILEP